MVVLNTREDLYRFLQEHGDSWVKREMLLFWGMHPNARFDRRAVHYALDYSRMETERALRTMVEEGLVDKNICNGVTLYSLTAEEERRRVVLELAALSWDQWSLMLMRVEQAAKISKCQDKAGTS